MAEHPLIQKYRAFSPASETLSQRARAVFPGGDTRSSAHYAPYPLAIAQATGCRMRDIDGHEIIDFMNNFTSLIHGHAHPGVVSAVQDQVAQGSAYAAPNHQQIEFAELLAQRVPSIEQLRFTSSGTEATLMAIRCARAATGRQKIMKMEGGYHGSYELAEVSLVPFPQLRGERDAPLSTAIDESFPESVLADTIACPYNAPDLAEKLINAHAEEIAAVVVEPALGSMGMVPASHEFLSTLRETTERHGIVLIFDEVITLRLSEGGAQKTLGIKPDLTAMGKIIGGGLPVGAVGGKRELMQLFSPDQKIPVMHASTFSGNALTMAAGQAAMVAYTEEEAERLNQLGDRLRAGFNQAFSDNGIKAQALGTGSLSNIHFKTGEVHDSREAFDGVVRAGRLANYLHLTMLRRGVMSATRLMYCTSTAMSETEIDAAIAALQESLLEMRPYIEADWSSLLN